MSLMLTICTPDAVVLATTNEHLGWLGRDRTGVIGHRCSEWATPRHWELSWHLFRHALSTGMPLAWERTVERPDGGQCRGEVTVKPLRTSRHGLVVLCANRVVASRRPTDYRESVARGLAEITDLIPRDMLRQSLEEIADEAARVAESSLGPLH